jgi:carboxyl-terminal processing protease
MSMGGIGAVVGMRDGYPTVVRVLPGSPAEDAGLRRDDRIVRIDGHRTRGGYLPQLVGRIRGAPGTTVVLWVARPKLRGGVSRPRRVPVVRAILRERS